MAAWHLVFGMYGFWLPNDPRGSWSTFVGNKSLYLKFGPATKVDTRQSIAGQRHDRTRRLAAKQTLHYPPVVVTGQQAREIALAMGDAVRDGGLLVLACAIMPEHVHVVIVEHRLTPQRIVARLKSRASRRLHLSGLWPEKNRPIWAKGHWKVHLPSDTAVRRAVRYVEENPVRAGFKPQHWSFVTKHDT